MDHEFSIGSCVKFSRLSTFWVVCWNFSLLTPFLCWTIIWVQLYHSNYIWHEIQIVLTIDILVWLIISFRTITDPRKRFSRFSKNRFSHQQPNCLHKSQTHILRASVALKRFWPNSIYCAFIYRFLDRHHSIQQLEVRMKFGGKITTSKRESSTCRAVVMGSWRWSWWMD